eukprot:m.170461 g.170461  ORF g.170461 m.170461 type:complete len:175 (-) comp15338_c0_seq21:139-663(-)
MFGIVHGGLNKEKRIESLRMLLDMGFDGLAIGGSLGKSKKDLFELLENIMPNFPNPLPRHLLGIADYKSISVGVAQGIDSFDSCYPTRMARHGTILTQGDETLNMRRSTFAQQFSEPLVPGCECSTCRRHSRAYIHHLVKAHEPVACTLLTTHNLRAMNDFMLRVRNRILCNEM